MNKENKSRNKRSEMNYAAIDIGSNAVRLLIKHSIFSKEQGNYGKLTRIWKEGFEYRPVETPALLDTEAEYIKFQKERKKYDSFDEIVSSFNEDI